jgi:hypothetical protein
VIKVCSLSLSDSLHCDKYTTFAQLYSIKCKKRLDNPLTGVYTVYVEWLKEKEMITCLEFDWLSEDQKRAREMARWNPGIGHPLNCDFAFERYTVSLHTDTDEIIIDNSSDSS